MLGYEERQPFLCNTSLCPPKTAAGKRNDISMPTWPLYTSPEADNHTRKPKLHPLMYLGMKPTKHRSRNLKKSRWTWHWFKLTFLITKRIWDTPTAGMATVPAFFFLLPVRVCVISLLTTSLQLTWQACSILPCRATPANSRFCT